MQNVCAGFVFLTSRLWLPAGLHTNQSTAAWHLRHASEANLAVLRHPALFCVSLCLLSNKQAGTFSFAPLVFNATPPTDVLVWLAPGPSRLRAWESRVVHFCWLDVTCLIGFFFSVCFSISGMYLYDLTYIDSAYPSTGSILENEQRSNLMNNILRIISDLQRSCTYGELRHTQLHKLMGWQCGICVCFSWNLNKLNKKDLGLVSPSAFCINQL